LSDDSTHNGHHQYPVVWRAGDGPLASGRLDVGNDGVVLHGSGNAEELRIGFGELSSIEIGRGASERINGDKSVVLERESCERVLIAALGGVGLLGEINDLLARLRAEHTPHARVAVVVPIRRGSSEQARELVAEGPPFNLASLELERHDVFVGEREVVFLLEGASAPAAVEALSQHPALLKAALRWRRILAGPPRILRQRFGWARETLG
jgi:hypothetical protein